jgi:WD40 repeat protein
MSSLPPATGRTIVAGLLAGALLVSTGCRSELDIEVGDPSDPAVEPVAALTGAPSAVWGSGRAVMSRTAADGTSVVVTTTGVFARADTADQPERIHTFDRATVFGTMAIDPAGAKLIVSTSTPSEMLWFDLATGQLTHAEALDAGTSFTTISFLSDGVGVFAAGPTGLTAWPDGPLSGPIALTDSGTPVGRAAVLGDGRVVAPIANTDALTVIDGLEATLVSLDLGEGSVVLDAQPTRAGDALAVNVGDRTNRLDSSDRILTLDPSTFGVRADIAVDRALISGTWALTDSHVVAIDRAGIEVWDLDGERVTTLTDTQDRGIDRIDPVDGGLVVSYPDGAMTIWSTDSWEPTAAVIGGVTLVDVAVDPDGRTLTTVDLHGRVQRRDTATGDPVSDVDNYAIGRLNGVAIDADGLRVGAVSSSGHVAILDRTLADEWVFQDTIANIDTIAFHPTSDTAVTGLAERERELAFDDTVTAWDLTHRADRFRLGGESEDVAGCTFFYNRIRFTSDGGLMATTSHDFSITIADSATGALVQQVPPHSTTLLDMAFTPDDDLFVVTSDDARVVVRETDNYTVLAEYQSPMGGYFGMAMLPDSATMAAIDLTGAIALVDIMTGERLLEFADARHRTAALAVSTDGTMLAAPAGDSTIGIWSTDTGTRLATLAGHSAPVTGVDFAPDGTWLASSSLDGTVRTWSLDATR